MGQVSIPTIATFRFFLAEELGNVGPTAQVRLGRKSLSENSKGAFGASLLRLSLPTNLTNDTNGDAFRVDLFVPFVRFVGNLLQ